MNDFNQNKPSTSESTQELDKDDQFLKSVVRMMDSNWKNGFDAPHVNIANYSSENLPSRQVYISRGTSEIYESITF